MLIIYPRRNLSVTQTEHCLNFCCEIGRQLLRNGAEIYRVEDSARRILAAYGYAHTEVFAIPSCIIINIEENGHNYTKSVRIRSTTNDLDKLERLNALSRSVCAQRPPLDTAEEQLHNIMLDPPHPKWLLYIAHGMAAGFFTLFWGGTPLDAVISFVCGMAVFFVTRAMSRRDANFFFTNILASMVIAAITQLLLLASLRFHQDMVIIGAIMLLVPGIAITNVMRDVLAGDFLTALSKFAEVIIVAVAIAVGIGIPLALGQMLPGGF